MILVDTSIWVDHLKRGDVQLVALLESAAVAIHPFIVGEIACGSLKDRARILELLQGLPAVTVAENDEVLGFVERHRLHGKGIGLVDVHLLASAALTQRTRVWTRDKRLHLVADNLGYAYKDKSAH